jgi:Cyclic nucleotide-binding domain
LDRAPQRGAALAITSASKSPRRRYKPQVSHSRRYSARPSAHAVVSAPPKGRRRRACADSTHRKEPHSTAASADELKSVQPWLTQVELRSNTVLREPGDAIERVYFPLSGMLSLLAVMQSGEMIETGIVGADGLVGGDAAINGHAFRQMTVQLDGAGLTMPRAKFI